MNSSLDGSSSCNWLSIWPAKFPEIDQPRNKAARVPRPGWGWKIKGDNASRRTSAASRRPRPPLAAKRALPASKIAAKCLRSTVVRAFLRGLARLGLPAVRRIPGKFDGGQVVGSIGSKAEFEQGRGRLALAEIDASQRAWQQTGPIGRLVAHEAIFQHGLGIESDLQAGRAGHELRAAGHDLAKGRADLPGADGAVDR